MFLVLETRCKGGFLRLGEESSSVIWAGYMATCLLCRLLCPLVSLPTSAAAGLHQLELHRNPRPNALAAAPGAHGTR